MVDNPLGVKLITDRLLQSWVRCRRKAWLDCYEDREKRLWTAHRTLQLDHQYRSFAALMPHKPGKGIEACVQGENGVMGLRLKKITSTGQLLEAYPPLLEKIGGKSIWGNFTYRPVIARNGKRLTREHRLTLAFSSLLLEPLQQAPIREGLAISIANYGLEKEKVKLNQKLQKELIESLAKLTKDLNKKYAPSITLDRRKCSLCSWRSICNSEAAKNGELTEVSGVGGSRKQLLQNLGINTIEELAAFNPVKLSMQLKALGGQHQIISNEIVAQAKAQCYGLVERLDPTKSLPELDKAPGVLLYDIESDPDAGENFLHGFMQVDRNAKGEWSLKAKSYRPILVIPEHNEELTWQRLKRKISLYKQYPILHYGETEFQILYGIAKRQGADEIELNELRYRLIDVHSRVRKYWRLPLNNYGLKTVANWLNFYWSQINCDGAKSLLWWRKWKRNGFKKRGHINSLRWIFQYNRDDCCATWKVAEWLLKQDS